MSSRIGRLAAAVLLALGAGVVGLQQPAAAVSNPLFIQTALANHCLDQHYYNGPTTTVYAWPTCHREHNQQWGFEHVWGNLYKIVNHRGGWCLSQPNPGYSRIYTEVCDPNRPNKQLWTQRATVYGYGQLSNVFTGKCLTVVPGAEVYGGECGSGYDVDPRTEWHWQPDPW